MEPLTTPPEIKRFHELSDKMDNQLASIEEQREYFRLGELIFNSLGPHTDPSDVGVSPQRFLAHSRAYPVVAKAERTRCVTAGMLISGL